jgi:hypothetical protein
MSYVCLNNGQWKNSQITNFKDKLFIFQTMQVGQRQWRIFPKLHTSLSIVCGAQHLRRRMWVYRGSGRERRNFTYVITDY